MPGLESMFLAIADDGVGMPEKVLRKAMEPFFTTKGQGAGTGLGLTSVASFAKQTGGFATVESAPGRGCAVSLYLPRCMKNVPIRQSARSEVPLGNGARHDEYLGAGNEAICTVPVHQENRLS